MWSVSDHECCGAVVVAFLLYAFALSATPLISAPQLQAYILKMADSFSIILISGASRGFGLAAAAQLSRQYPHSSMHLMASSIGRLDVASKLLVSRGHKGSIFHHGVELSKLASGDTSQCSSLVQALSAADAQQKVLFVHSAAVLGPTGPVEKFGLSNIAEISQAVQVNIGLKGTLSRI